MKHLLMVLPLLVSGCATVQPQITSADFNPEVMEILGPALGASVQEYIFFVPIDDPASTDQAVAAALKASGGDALINASVDREDIFFPIIYRRQTIRVSGTAVRFKRNLPGTTSIPQPRQRRVVDESYFDPEPASEKKR